MGNGDGSEQDQQTPERDELEDLDAGDEQDQHDSGGEFAAHEKALGSLVKEAEQAGFANSPQMASLKAARRALRRSRQHIQEAEARGRARALEEFQSGDGQAAVQALRAQVEAELAETAGRERSLARIGLAPDSPLRALFADVSGDFPEFQRRADALRAQGIQWGSDPLLAELGRQRLAAAQAAAAHAQQNGGPVTVGPAPGVPAEVQEQLVRGAVEAMQAGQAGGEPVGVDHLEDEIRKADPERLGQAGVHDLARRFNDQLDAISHQARGGW